MTASDSTPAMPPSTPPAPVATPKFRRFIALAILAAGVLAQLIRVDGPQFSVVTSVGCLAAAALAYRNATAIITAVSVFLPLALFIAAGVGLLVR